MKKVLILSLMYYPRVGGAEIAIKEITDRISSEDIEFHMVTIGGDPTLSDVEKVGNVTVHRIEFFKKEKGTINDFYRFPLKLNKWIFQYSAFRKATELHRAHSYDAIWAMMAQGAGIPALLFKRKFPTVPYLLTLQEGLTKSAIRRKMLPLYPLFTRAIRDADFIQAISHYLKGFAHEMGFRGSLEVIPNGVDVSLFSKEFNEKERIELRNTLGKKEGDVFLITTSRLVEKNACDDVIKALVHLPQNVHFIILGTGPDEGKLRALAHTCNVEERVQFLGFVDYKDIPRYFSVADIFIRPSLSEGMGNSFIEAMAAGLPVIATQVGGIADFLYDPLQNTDKAPTGRAVSPRDPEGIARAVQLYLTEKHTTETIVQNAKRLVVANYTWEKVAEDMKRKVFDKLLK